MFYNESHLCFSFPFNFLTPRSLFRLFAYHQYSDSNHTTSNLLQCVYCDWCKSCTLSATLFSAHKLPVFQMSSCFISSTDHTYCRYICTEDWTNETFVLCARLCNFFWNKNKLWINNNRNVNHDSVTKHFNPSYNNEAKYCNINSCLYNAVVWFPVPPRYMPRCSSW